MNEVESTARNVLEAYADKRLAGDGVPDVTTRRKASPTLLGSVVISANPICIMMRTPEG